MRQRSPIPFLSSSTLILPLSLCSAYLNACSVAGNSELESVEGAFVDRSVVVEVTLSSQQQPEQFELNLSAPDTVRYSSYQWLIAALRGNNEYLQLERFVREQHELITQIRVSGSYSEIPLLKESNVVLLQSDRRCADLFEQGIIVAGRFGVFPGFLGRGSPSDLRDVSACEHIFGGSLSAQQQSVKFWGAFSHCLGPINVGRMLVHVGTQSSGSSLPSGVPLLAHTSTTGAYCLGISYQPWDWASTCVYAGCGDDMEALISRVFELHYSSLLEPHYIPDPDGDADVGPAGPGLVFPASANKKVLGVNPTTVGVYVGGVSLATAVAYGIVQSWGGTEGAMGTTLVK